MKAFLKSIGKDDRHAAGVTVEERLEMNPGSLLRIETDHHRLERSRTA